MPLLSHKAFAQWSTPMASMLYDTPAKYLSPAEGFAAKQAEFDTHEAAMQIRDEICGRFPNEQRSEASLYILTGLVSALARMLAEYPNQIFAHLFIAQLSRTVAIEHADWTDKKSVH